MGDSGIYLLSTFIGLYTIYKYNSDTTYLYSEEIFLIFMIPGIDMFRLFCKRLYNKKNPFKGDLDHLHHLLKNRYNLKISLTIYIILVAWPNIVAKLIVINHVYLIVINILVYSLLVINYKNKIN